MLSDRIHRGDEKRFFLSQVWKNNMKLYLHIQDELLGRILAEVLVQGSISLVQNATECEGILYTPPYTPPLEIPSLNFLTLPQPIKLVDLLSRLHQLPYRQSISFSHFSLDLREKTLTNLTSLQTQRLTEKEVQLLHFFIQNKGQAISRNRLLKAIWAYHPEVETHTLETHIYRLRQKLEADPANPTLLINCESGYILV